jgi:hypothetical protein
MAPGRGTTSNIVDVEEFTCRPSVLNDIQDGKRYDIGAVTYKEYAFCVRTNPIIKSV